LRRFERNHINKKFLIIYIFLNANILKGKNLYKSFAVFRVPPTSPNLLISEFVGEPSVLSELTSDECLIAYFKDLLNTFYPDITFPNIIQLVRSKWATNPLIQGAYTFVPPGSSIDDIVNLGEPLVNTFN
jgi:hypothetical protein